MKRPHILDMDQPGWEPLCGRSGFHGIKVAVSPHEHERHPERTCEACREAHEGRKAS